MIAHGPSIAKLRISHRSEAPSHPESGSGAWAIRSVRSRTSEMLKTGVQPIVRVLLDRHGQLYSEAIGIDMRQGTPGW